MQRNSDKMFDRRSERLYGVYSGRVVDNSDFQRMGRLQVWISELCSAPDDSIPVVYAPPFGGATNPDDIDSDELRTFDGTQQSYGFWAVPPDINNTVLVMFIDGHMSKGIWFSCLYQQYTNHMVPNIPVGPTFQEDDAGDGVQRPSAEYNKNTRNATEAVNSSKPYHKPHYEGIRNQGLKDDPVRGYSQHGSRSERTSRVMGMLSPRSHYWSIEDTEDDEKIRLRTRSGAQLLLDETRGIVYFINKSGKGWFEIDDEGKGMIYAEQGFAVRSQGDINFRADNDLIFEAGRDIFMRSESNTFFENESFYHKSNEDHIVNVTGIKSERLGQYHAKIEDDVQIVSDDYKIGSGTIDLNSSGDFNATASSDVNLSGTNSNVTGSGNINLLGSGGFNASSGGSMNLAAASILQNVGGGAAAAQTAAGSSPSVTSIPDMDLFQKTDITQPESDDDPEETAVETIVTIFPTHEPCPEHDQDPEER